MPLPRFAKGCCSLTVEGAQVSDCNGEYMKLGPLEFRHRSRESGSKVWYDEGAARWLMGDPRHRGGAAYSAPGTGDEPPASGWQALAGRAEPAPRVWLHGNLAQAEDLQRRLRRLRPSRDVFAVEGGGFSEHNGSYARVSEKELRRSAGGGSRIWYIGERGFWYLGNPEKYGGKASYLARGSSDGPPRGGWQIADDGNGVEPCPGVRRIADPSEELGAAVRAARAAKEEGRLQRLQDLHAAVESAEASLAEGGQDDAAEPDAEGAGGGEPSSLKPQRVLILCWGSRGDVQPFCALGKGLVERGHEVRCAASDGFREMVESYGMAYTCMSVDMDMSKTLHLAKAVLTFFATRELLRYLLFAPVLATLLPGIDLPTLLVQHFLQSILVGAASPVLNGQLSRFVRMPCPRLALRTSVTAEVVVPFLNFWTMRSIAEGMAKHVGYAPVLHFVLTNFLQYLATFYQHCSLFFHIVFGSLVTKAAEEDKAQCFVDWTIRLGALGESALGGRPDAIVCQTNCYDVGIALSSKYRVPLLFAGVMTEGLSRATGRDWEASYKHAVAREELLFSPSTGESPIKSMGCEAYRRLMTENVIYGVPSFLAGHRSAARLFGGPGILRDCTLTGAWLLDSNQEEEVSPSMFGGIAVKARLEAFLDAGEKPVYIGWGSMVSAAGAVQMCRLAVGALKVAEARGVVLGGWAKLDIAMLKEKDAETRSLRAYAEENILFLDKAPHSWLLPRCSCAVTHGGISTLLTCWRAGVPSIVTPVIADQSFNRLMNMLVDGGVFSPELVACSATALGNSLKYMAGDATLASDAAKLRDYMARDRGVPTAVAHIEGFMLAHASG